jgi:hypothetical protein
MLHCFAKVSQFQQNCGERNFSFDTLTDLGNKCVCFVWWYVNNSWICMTFDVCGHWMRSGRVNVPQGETPYPTITMYVMFACVLNPQHVNMWCVSMWKT